MDPNTKIKPGIGPEAAKSSTSSQLEPGGHSDSAVNNNPWLAMLRQPWLRWFGFFMLLAVLIAVFVLARPAVSSWLSASTGNNAAVQTPSASEEAGQSLPQVSRSSLNPYLSRLITSGSTEPADFRADVITYTVQSGDYLFAIADKFKIKPETILWSNYDVLKDNPEIIVPGQVLNILPVDGLYYQWQAGDRLDTVAGTYGVTPEDIILWPSNYLSPTIDIQKPDITPGTWLVVPGGHREFKAWEPQVIRSTSGTSWTFGGPGACNGVYSGSAGTGAWFLPTASNWIVGNNYSAYHHGIDLYLTLGEPVHAADRGVTVYAGWNTWGYGNLVVIDHGNGWQTVYGHLSRIDVGCGYTVQRGGQIGLGGSTGNSTGPHLHFEMIYNGVRVDPHGYYSLR
ncbi:MAG: peptidoglycan DD-metalloendopeptidase family protein [Anaerolineales bacterium]|jgi:murein DD-endopeptidase MepM/ murein hydrolase activator NlpD